MKLVDVLNEGKKVARLVANRDLDPKNVKQKKESLKKCGVLTPAVIVNGNKAVEQDLEIVDFITGEVISKEDAHKYIVLVEGNHRYQAHLELLKANGKLEEEQKYKKEFFVTYPLDDNMSIMDMLAEINTCTNKWDTKDRVRGKYLDPLKNDAGIERGLKILNAAKSKLGEDLCKTRTTLSGWIVSKYEKTLDADKANFTDNMIQFINSIDSDNVTYLQKVKGKKGGSSKENLINKKLNELWDSFNVSVESAE